MKNYFNMLRLSLTELHRISKRFGSWYRVVKSSRAGLGYFNKVILVLLGKFSKSYVMGNVSFVRFLRKQHSKQGVRGVALYLKTAQLLLVRAANDTPIRNPRVIGVPVSVTAKGIPRIIPVMMRREILAGNGVMLRYWITLFGLYRIMEFKAKMNTKTITAPGPKIDINKWKSFTRRFFDLTRVKVNLTTLSWKPLLILKSGPGTRAGEPKKNEELRSRGLPPLKWFATSVAALQLTARELRSNQSLYASWVAVAKLLGFRRLINWIENIQPIGSLWMPEPKLILGKLGIKIEPGKVRVFAMVDWWTQVLLKPIHSELMKVISLWPMDSTMNQLQGVVRLQEIISRTGFSASYDLSAATDRLPVTLQAHLLDCILPGLGDMWKYLLVGREYTLGRRKRLRYATGQPMGAYSSWAMLALTHHFIVQVAAWKALNKLSLFEDYQLLGDDIVICHPAVARQYLILMNQLGVGINMSKSIVSRSLSFEFAKRLGIKGQDVSPMAFKEMEAAQGSLSALAYFMTKWAGDKTQIGVIARIMGSGYRACSKLTGSLDGLSMRNRGLIIWLSMPGVSKFSFETYTEWLGMVALKRTSPLSPEFQESVRSRIKILLEGLRTKREVEGEYHEDTYEPSFTTWTTSMLSDKVIKGMSPEIASILGPIQGQVEEQNQHLDRRIDSALAKIVHPSAWAFEQAIKAYVELKLDIAAGAGNVDLRFREEGKDIFSPGSWISLFESLKFGTSTGTGRVGLSAANYGKSLTRKVRGDKGTRKEASGANSN